MTQVELDEFFETTGPLLMKRFFKRYIEIHTIIKRRRGSNMVELNETEARIYGMIKKGTKDTNALMARTRLGRHGVIDAIHHLIKNGMVYRQGVKNQTTYHANVVSYTIVNRKKGA